jgi:hypothetical protein
MAGATKENLPKNCQGKYAKKIRKEKSTKENPQSATFGCRSFADLLPIPRQSAEAALVPVFSRIW